MTSRSPTSGRARPAVSHDTAFFWDGTRRGELRLQRCTACGTLRHPPGPSCPRCHALGWDWTVASGRGGVYSYVVQHHPLPPGFDEPFVIALVELDEGPRVVATLDVAPDAVAIGLRVVARFVPQDEGWVALDFAATETPE